MLSPDERVAYWLACRVARPLANSADLHYRDCPEIVIDHQNCDESPLSDVTKDIVCRFYIRWGCKHGPRRFDGYVHYHSTLADLIEELVDVEPVIGNTFYARHYPAPEKGTVYAPDG